MVQVRAMRKDSQLSRSEQNDIHYCRMALRLARRGYGRTSPNPMVGAVLVAGGRVIGQGWHRGAGLPHAEIEALADAARRGQSVRHRTLYVSLEPCCTRGRTPPCTEAIIAARIRRVVVCTEDPNPRHQGRGLARLREAGIEVASGILAVPAQELNVAFSHWIIHRTPYVTAKAALTLDGKIATATGESRWITGEASRQRAMRLRAGVDAVLVGIETVLADDPQLTVRGRAGALGSRQPRRIVLDSRARTPLTARLLSPATPGRALVVVGPNAPARRVAALRRWAEVWSAPLDATDQLDLRWLLTELGRNEVTSLLVEGGGEVHGSFFQQGLVHRTAFFYGPLILGGRRARRAVAGSGATDWSNVCRLLDPQWRCCGPDLWLTARVQSRQT
jgi:diaminohydroxyphosphoribosylaminopyrimidine deaminase/5-amino-6-(5-phosphoribosylamino)uracil reductase